MSKPTGVLLTCLGIFLTATAAAQAPAAETKSPQAIPLPDWQVLEFEERAYWATAKSRLEILPNEEDETLWDLEAISSVLSNSEQVDVVFEADTGQPSRRSRISRGSEQRMKSYQYGDDSVLRERRKGDSNTPPDKWPVSSSKQIDYPASAAEFGITSPYLLMLLAQRLQAQGLDKSQEVLVHTDQNFYRARLTSGRGLAIEANYSVDGGDNTSGSRATRAVALHVEPEGELADNSDFDLLGLREDIIIFFDEKSGLPLQVRGKAPRIGDTSINLRAVTMRQSGQ